MTKSRDLGNLVSDGTNESPVILTEPPTSTVEISSSGTTDVTMVAQDPEGFDITYGIAYKTANNAVPSQLNSAPSINQSTGVYTFTPTSNTSNGGNFTARLSASDGVKTTTRLVDFNLALGIVTSNLILHVDAGLSSTIQDHSGNGNTVSKTSGVDFTTAGTGGVASYWSFDNVADYIDTNVQRTNSDFSYSAWFSFDSLTSYNKLICTQESTSQEWTSLNVSSSGYSQFIIDNDGDNTGGDAVKVTLTDTTTQMSSGTWYNMCATYNSTSGAMKLYLNGSQVATTTHSQTGTITGVEPIRIGGRSFSTNSTERWIGDIAVVLTYSKELSSTEVTQNWDAYKARYGL